MKVGDLVKSKGHFRNQLGVIVEAGNPSDYNYMGMFRVRWFVFDHEFRGWYGAHKLEAVKKL
tara:strand:- start:390 stop:575 length:186 start_codon:yes stop_codon:yes gene_type:complete